MLWLGSFNESCHLSDACKTQPTKGKKTTNHIFKQLTASTCEYQKKQLQKKLPRIPKSTIFPVSISSACNMHSKPPWPRVSMSRAIWGWSFWTSLMALMIWVVWRLSWPRIVGRLGTREGPDNGDYHWLPPSNCCLTNWGTTNDGQKKGTCISNMAAFWVAMLNFRGVDAMSILIFHMRMRGKYGGPRELDDWVCWKQWE